MRLAVLTMGRVPDRFTGFARGFGVEVAPGVFVLAGLSRRALDEAWRVLASWHAAGLAPDGWLLLMAPSAKANTPPELRVLGLPRRRLVRVDEVYCVEVEN